MPVWISWKNLKRILISVLLLINSLCMLHLWLSKYFSWTRNCLQESCKVHCKVSSLVWRSELFKLSVTCLLSQNVWKSAHLHCALVFQIWRNLGKACGVGRGRCKGSKGEMVGQGQGWGWGSAQKSHRRNLSDSGSLPAVPGHFCFGVVTILGQFLGDSCIISGKS